jgi:quercetin dioxygenase-like cupin family protein
MMDEVLFHRGNTLVRRLRLAPGEAMPWHSDPQRAAVILGGDFLSIEYRDGGENQRIEITPGEVEWEEPTTRVHRAVNVGKQPYEQVTVFLTGTDDEITMEGGKKSRDHYVWTDVFVKRSGKWLAVASQTALIK